MNEEFLDEIELDDFIEESVESTSPEEIILDEISLDFEELDLDGISSYFENDLLEEHEIADIIDVELDGSVEDKQVPAVSSERFIPRVRVTESETLIGFAEVIGNFSDVLTPIIENDRQAINAISKNLINYYDTHNTVFPQVSSDKDTHRGSVRSIIINDIRNGRSIASIIYDLKELFDQNNVEIENGKYFRLTGANEVRAIEFLNSFLDFYDVSYKSTDPSLALTRRNSEVLHGIREYVEHTVKVISAGDSHSVWYPRRVFLDKEMFVCGECGELSRYSNPFITCFLLNTDSEGDFVSVLPTVEICENCGSANTMPYNYFSVISEVLKNEYSNNKARDVRDRMKSLHPQFTVYRYGFPMETMLEAGRANSIDFYDMSDGGVEVVENHVEFRESFDFEKSKNLYLKKKEQFKIVSTPMSYSEAVNSDYTFSEKYMKEFRSSITRLFCSALNVNYGNLKTKAINSLIFFIEDSVPFCSNPFNIVKSSADQAMGLIEDDLYLDITNEYMNVVDGLTEIRDWLSFVPLSFSTPNHNKFEQYSSDERMRDLLDYCSDNMILFHLRKDIQALSVIGRDKGSKINLKKIMADPHALASNIRKYEKEIGKETEHGSLSFMLKKFMTQESSSFEFCEYKTLFRHFSNKDIYSIVNFVFSQEDSILVDLRNSLLEIKQEIGSKSRLEFSYGDMFPGEDFSEYEADQINVLYRLVNEENKTLGEYLRDIKRIKVGKLMNESIVCQSWFYDNMGFFFDVLRKFLRYSIETDGLIFMDIMKYSACYSFLDFAETFGMSEAVSRFYLSNSDSFEFPKFCKDYELAKMILISYPYKDDTLCLIANSDVNDREGEEALLSSLLYERDSLYEEFKELPQYLKELLEEQFDLKLHSIGDVSIRSVSE